MANDAQRSEEMDIFSIEGVIPLQNRATLAFDCLEIHRNQPSDNGRLD